MVVVVLNVSVDSKGKSRPVVVLLPLARGRFMNEVAICCALWPMSMFLVVCYMFAFKKNTHVPTDDTARSTYGNDDPLTPTPLQLRDDRRWREPTSPPSPLPTREPRSAILEMGFPQKEKWPP